MDIIITMLIGLAVGAMVELLLPGHHPAELLLAMLLGVAGALLVRFIGHWAAWFEPEDAIGFVAAVFGAILLIVLYGSIFGRLRRRDGREKH